MAKYNILIGENKYEVEIISDLGDWAQVKVNGVNYEVKVEEVSENRRSFKSDLTEASSLQSHSVITTFSSSSKAPLKAKVGGEKSIQAPMPGVILEVKVQVGQVVKAGDVVVRLEAMKMENDIPTVVDGVVKEVLVKKGDSVQEHEVLVVLED